MIETTIMESATFYDHYLSIQFVAIGILLFLIFLTTMHIKWLEKRKKKQKHKIS